MSKTVVIVGSQWGDEGKGKITNYFSEKADVVVRYQGGDNAGHTICFDNKTYKLHLLPSGVFDANTKNVLGNGMVINPRSLVREITEIRSYGFAVDNIYISDRAHVIFDHHLELDGLREKKLGKAQIGTTKKGIGPTYTDKASRIGMRIADFVAPSFRETFKHLLTLKNEEIKTFGGNSLDYQTLLAEYQKLADEIRPLVCDTIQLINKCYNDNEKILFEGAQGALLDIDFGTYPYVTSSNTSSGGVASGSGLGITKIEDVIGVVKAYTTRVGEGPLPTELQDNIGDKIRQLGNEFGTTTNRARRVGWFDAVVVKYSAMINGMTGLSLMLLDVLSTFDEIKICTHYTLNDQEIDYIPARIQDFEKCKPHYITLQGWNKNLDDVQSFDDLPKNAQKYIETIEKLVGVRVVCFSFGPDKKQTIIRKEIF